MISMPVELYTDGSCLRNPGAGGIGYVIRYWEDKEGGDLPEVKMIEGNQGFRLTTNNRMEISAGIYGITKVISLVEDGTLSGISQLNIVADSEYFCNAINQRWINKWMQNNWMTSGWKGSKPQPVKNKDLWEQVINLQNKLQQMRINMTISHVHSHDKINGNEFNDKADKLAVAASSGTDHIIDEVYEKTTNVVNRR